MSNRRLSRVLRFLVVILTCQVGIAEAAYAQFEVNSADDADDATCDGTHCSLREAINAANLSGGSDVIQFNIAGTPPFVIQPTTALPTIDEAVSINGFLAIVIDGSLLAGSENGLEVTGTGGGTTLRGLVVQNFPGAGIRLSSGSNVVAGNRLGTSADGLTAAPNFHGIFVDAGAGNSIGGTGGGDRNLISGNGNDGVHLTGTASGTLVRRNFIGLDATGGAALPNGRNGVHIDGSAGNFVGTTPNHGNVISGNAREGVFITGAGATNNRLENNIIGTDSGKTGTKLGNGHNNGGGTKYSGVRITGGAGGNRVGSESSSAAGNTIGDSHLHGVLLDGGGSANLVRGNVIGTVDGTTHVGNHVDGVRVETSSTAVGGTSAGAGNLIAFQGDDGVSVVGGSVTGVSILGNSIYDNANVSSPGPAYLGIDLGDDDVTPNDAGDGDNGPNGLQNFPVLTSVVDGGDILGSLNSLASTQYRIEFFANPSCDPTGNGEGKTFLGFSDETTDGSGNVNFSVNFGGLTAGWFITATATTAGFSTSEFSACAQVEQGSDVEVTKSGPATVGAGANFDYTVTVTNNGPATATDVVIKDDVPGAVTFVSASDGGVFSSGTVTWPTIASLANGAMVQYTVTVTAPLNGSFDNVAHATSSSPDGNSSNNDGSDPSAQVSTTVTQQADLEVSKTGPTGVNAGASFGYTLTVTNNGPNTAVDVVITDALPGVVTFVSASDGGVESSGTVTWPTISLTSGQSVERTVTVTAPASGTFLNVASAAATTADPDATNNDGTNSAARVSTTVGELADVAVTKSGAATVDAGANLVYTLTVTNNGPSTATGVVISDALPGSATFVSASNSGSESAGTVTWPAISLTNGQSVQRTVTVTAPASGTLLNVASATATTADPTASNNNGSNSGAKVTTTVNGLADIEVSKTGPPNVAAGANFDYTITVTNHGPSAAADVVITDDLPSNGTYVTSSDSGSEAAGTVTWPAVASLASGQSVMRTVTVTAPLSGTLDNVAQATTTTADPDATNNNGTNAGSMVSTTVTEPADVQVTKTGPASVTANADLSYTLTIMNNGPNTATGVVIKDVLPGTVTFVSASDGGLESGGTVTWPTTSLTNGQSVTRTVTVTAPSSGTLLNVASATATTPDLNQANNNGTAANARVQTTVQSFSLSVAPPSATVPRGEDASYVVTVSPEGATFGNAVSLSCAGLPAGASCSFNPVDVTPGVNAAASTLTVSTTASVVTPTGASTFRVVANSGPITKEVMVDLNITKDFALGVTPTAATVTRGGAPAMFTLTVEDSGFFNDQISFACSDLPAGASCAFSPSTFTPNGADGAVQVSVSTNGTTAGMTFPGESGELPWWVWLGMILIGLPMCLAGWRRERSTAGVSRMRPRMATAMIVILLGCVTWLTACGDSPTEVTDVTKTFTITGTAGSVSHSTTATITIQP